MPAALTDLRTLVDRLAALGHSTEAGRRARRLLDDPAVQALLDGVTADLLARAVPTDGRCRPVSLLLFRLADRHGPGVLHGLPVPVLDRYDHAHVDGATGSVLGPVGHPVRETARTLRGRWDRPDDGWQGTVGELIAAARRLGADA